MTWHVPDRYAINARYIGPTSLRAPITGTTLSAERICRHFMQAARVAQLFLRYLSSVQWPAFDRRELGGLSEDFTTGYSLNVDFARSAVAG